MTDLAEELATKRAQLAEVRAAITAVMTKGQSYTIQDGGAMRQLTRANMAWLQEREKELEVIVNRLSRGGGIGINYGMPQ